MEREGGFAQLKGDETTNHGVTKTTWESYVGHPVTVKDIQKLTINDILPLYKTKYWNASSCDKLPSGVDGFVFDFAVHSGVGTAIRHLQNIVGVLSDGSIGKLTLASVGSMEPKVLLDNLYKDRMAYIKKLKNYKSFKKGWENRINIVNRFCQKLADESLSHSRPAG